MTDEIPWGPTGELVYKRTYARTKPDGSKETWPETVVRVVDGNLALVPGRYQVPGERDDLIRLMTEFKVLPAGRHLWASGVTQHLFNCWVSGWPEKISDHFHFTFMRLMEGGGVGANYSNHYLEGYPAVVHPLQVHIVCDPEHRDYEAMKSAGILSEHYDSDWVGAFAIEDSREGWSSALVDLIDTHYRPDTVHFQRVYDVSRIRPAGAKLKTFGGHASGPEPFAVMLQKVAGIMSDRSGEILTGIDAMEIDHAIASCVVAGGVRRSARMSMMHWADYQIGEFINIKATSGEHWTTNISVEVDAEFWEHNKHPMVGDEYNVRRVLAHQVMLALSSGAVRNGEPGMWDSSLSNVGEPNQVVCTNPCFHPDTLVETVNGPMRIADITEPTQVYTKGPTGKLEIRKASAAFVTKRNAPTLRIGLTNGDSLVVTPDHRIMRRDGSYVPAFELSKGDALETICRARRGWRYSGVKLASEPNRAYRMEHRMIYEGVHGELPPGYDVDHINRDHHDNRIENLQVLTHSEHARLSRLQVPNDHQQHDENGKYAKSGNSGKKLLEDAIRPPRGTNWGRTPRVAYVAVGPVSDVYDIQVDETHNLIANGVVAHNCGEITLEPWEPCNLGHINMAAFVRDNGKTDYLGMLKAHRLVTRFLIRATFSEVADPKSREVLDRNRRIGVGHLGVASYLALTGQHYNATAANRKFKALLRELADEVDKAAEGFCHELRIPVPVKKRTIAPTGTVAKLAGVSEGIHPIFSKYFIRRIRFNQTSDFAALAQLVNEGYEVEDDLFAPNTAVVSIPTKDTLLAAVEAIWGAELAEDLVQSADELSLQEMLSVQATYQMLWADNAVSFTANVDPEAYTAGDVAETLQKFAGLIKGATVFPELSFPQPPYERISKSDYEAATAKAVADGVDENCANGGACPIR